MKDNERLKFTVDNYEALIKQYKPLISKQAYLLYSKYSTVIDYDDALQEIKICFYRCLVNYVPKQYRFMTYFYNALSALKKRYYFSYYHQFNISCRSAKPIADDNSDAQQGKSKMDDAHFVAKERADDVVRSLRFRLTPRSVIVFDVFLARNRVGPWNLVQDLGLSRYEAKLRFLEFKNEVAKLRGD